MRLLLLFLFCFASTHGQDSVSLKQTKYIGLAADTFWGADAYSNLYYSTNNTLFKKGDNGMYQFKSLQLSEISSVDILNPLEVTVFYKQFNTAVILDNNLNQITSINFNTINQFKNVSFATTGTRHQLWIFNTDLQQIELFNYQTQTFKNVGLPIKEKVIDLKSNYNFCWVLTEHTIYKYNVYGSLLYKFPFNNGELLSVADNQVLVKRKNELFYIENNSTKIIHLQPESNLIKDVFLTGDNLYIYNGKSSLIVYPNIKL